MKTSVQDIAINGNKDKAIKRNGKKVSTNIDKTLNGAFDLHELLSVLTEMKNENFAIHLPNDEVGLNGKIWDTMTQVIATLSNKAEKNKNQEWLQQNLSKLTSIMQGQRNLDVMTKQILSELVSMLSVHYGTIYISRRDEEAQTTKLKLFAVYAGEEESKVQKEFAVGEGLVGQCAFERKRILITNAPKGYVRVNSSSNKTNSFSLCIFPVLFENKVKAVIELASLNSLTETQLDLMSQLTEKFGAVLNIIDAFTRTEELLIQTQSHLLEMQNQQRELRIRNEMLEDKSSWLDSQNRTLAIQNGEKEKLVEQLRIANEELAFQNMEKEKRATELSNANKEIDRSRKMLEEKASQLALSSKYKSEFLANMSHELRSPLNSLLILAQQLYENLEGNLTEKQIRYAKTIYSCGDDLIQLINDILDLSKIESRVISINPSNVRISEIATSMETTFRPISEYKNIAFNIQIDKDLPMSMNTDVLRLNQILKNLLSNAFKFTEKGKVTLRISESKRPLKSEHAGLRHAKRVISFSIHDTGIGIPKEKQLLIFEAFQQAEGSISRKFGGTGLGLSISRGLIDLLGGVIELESELGMGSTFTLYLPLEMIPHAQAVQPKIISTPVEKVEIVQALEVGEEQKESQSEVAGEIIIDATGDDRNNINPDDKIVLVIEDDVRFAKIMIEKAHENGMKAITAITYQEVFDFTKLFQPAAIILDVHLPASSGWKIIQMLRSDALYCHIPFHIISGEENRVMALRRGARSFLLKPLENSVLNQLFTDINVYAQKVSKSILVVEDNEIESSQVAKMLSINNVDIEIVKTCKDAVDLISKKDYDCIILDYLLPDKPGDQVVHEITAAKKIFTPVIIYSSRDFNREEINNVKYNSNSHITKGVDSLEVLLAETVSQLHINLKNLAPDKRKIIESIRNKKDVLTNKNILVVDDDIRNLFAMTTVFERFNMKITTAESGNEAIEILSKSPEIEMVVMDIMMPEMDGYEAIRKIRQDQKNSSLPIIAVTAKAMKHDRDKCIESGASDYIPKPIKTDQLLSLMRLWFCKQ